jgi:hypothetical protein
MKKSKKMITRLILAVFCFFALIQANYAWGPVGHQTIAYIAEDHLTPTAKQKVYTILGLDETQDMASVATWADDVRIQPKYKPTASWHYIDFDVRMDNTVDDYVKYCPNDDCVVAQIEKKIAELKTTTDETKQNEDLKFLIHFVGDVHCPMHSVDDNDKGGNLKTVKLFKPDGTGRGNTMKLHAVWDRLIESKTSEDPRELADQLEKKITKKSIADLQKGTAKD